MLTMDTTSFLVAGKNSSIKGQNKALVFIGELKIHGKEFAEFLVAFRQDLTSSHD